MLIEKFKEKLKEIREPILRLNVIKTFLNKQLEEFVEAMIISGSSSEMKAINEVYKYNSNGYQFEISIKFEKDVALS